MKKEALERIRKMVAPVVTIDSCVDTPNGIKADIRHTYHFPDRQYAEPIPWVKVFTVLADDDGNVYSAPGLL